MSFQWLWNIIRIFKTSFSKMINDGATNRSGNHWTTCGLGWLAEWGDTCGTSNRFVKILFLWIPKPQKAPPLIRLTLHNFSDEPVDVDTALALTVFSRVVSTEFYANDLWGLWMDRAPSARVCHKPGCEIPMFRTFSIYWIIHLPQFWWLAANKTRHISPSGWVKRSKSSIWHELLNMKQMLTRWT